VNETKVRINRMNHILESWNDSCLKLMINYKHDHKNNGTNCIIRLV